MSIEKYDSEVKVIASSQESVYNHLANLKNLESLFDVNRFEELKKQYPNAPDLKLDSFRATEDECSFSISPIGQVRVEIIEREPSKLIKLAGSKALPFGINCWIQLLPLAERTCKIKITIHADLNPMIKMVIDKHIKSGVDQIAEALTRISYPDEPLSIQ